MNSLTRCPDLLPEDLTSLIAEFGKAWASSDKRPRPDSQTIVHWTNLISEWVNASDLPLFVRKSGKIRGSVETHSSRRQIVYCDNSPAHWAYVMASRGVRPTFDTIISLVKKHLIPVVYIQKPAERSIATYQCSLRQEFNVNHHGWKLAHIDPVGLRSRVLVSQIPIEKIEDHFRALMSPGNMFVVPPAWAGLAEAQSVIDAIVAADKAA